MEKKRNIVLVFCLFFLAAVLSGAELEVEYRCVNPTPHTQQIQVHLNILNNSRFTVSMADLTIRYYYLKEGTVPEIMNIDYATFGSSNVMYTFFPDYVELGFTEGAGTIINGNDSGEIQIRFHKSDWSSYDQSNDYSFAPANNVFSPNANIALYLSGSLVWGTTHGDEPENTPFEEEGADANTGPSPSPGV